MACLRYTIQAQDEGCSVPQDLWVEWAKKAKDEDQLRWRPLARRPRAFEQELEMSVYLVHDREVKSAPPGVP